MSLVKPLILVTNDDGILAPGIKTLVEIAREFGTVVVVAPNSPQSGQGHAITLESPLRLFPVDFMDGVEAYECSGTPVDCVKLAKHVILKGQKTDLCLSGINHGANSSINIIYSGTMSAAMEASLEKIPSIGFSLLDFSFEADFNHAKDHIRRIIAYVLKHKPLSSMLLNVNIPHSSAAPLKGIKVCRQAEARWVEEFLEGRDPRGQKYYWLSGKFIYEDHGEDTDIWALENGFVSIVPSMHDLTHYRAMDGLKPMEEI